MILKLRRELLLIRSKSKYLKGYLSSHGGSQFEERAYELMVELDQMIEKLDNEVRDA
jgi:hypothetical protein